MYYYYIIIITITITVLKEYMLWRSCFVTIRVICKGHENFMTTNYPNI